MERIQLVAALLDQIRAYLVRYGVRTWPEILTEWKEMLNRVRTDEDAAAVFRHIYEGLWGMGRLADVVITPEAGHAVTADHDQLNVINNEYMSLVNSLSHEVSVQATSRDKVVR
jgi:biotin-(acetyl-CoA carboxylase) ligase